MGMTSNKDIHERVDYVSEGYGVRDSSVKSSPSPCNHLIVVGQFVTLSQSRQVLMPCVSYKTRYASHHLQNAFLQQGFVGHAGYGGLRGVA